MLLDAAAERRGSVHYRAVGIGYSRVIYYYGTVVTLTYRLWRALRSARRASRQTQRISQRIQRMFALLREYPALARAVDAERATSDAARTALTRC